MNIVAAVQYRVYRDSGEQTALHHKESEKFQCLLLANKGH